MSYRQRLLSEFKEHASAKPFTRRSLVGLLKDDNLRFVFEFVSSRKYRGRAHPIFKPWPYQNEVTGWVIGLSVDHPDNSSLEECAKVIVHELIHIYWSNWRGVLSENYKLIEEEFIDGEAEAFYHHNKGFCKALYRRFINGFP
ncbi:hypothetical protein COU61_01615 [Candidatus Pacearchaeota archaeon CG10_big_fil_rev_8_21_14_0_10_35_13]|nr:MAG: hypothetical protein COU61_01615 [Candidatus Pacearchaeota archaeon CG10_big_fil_rev_8_21_14_0_10_35_13]